MSLLSVNLLACPAVDLASVAVNAPLSIPVISDDSDEAISVCVSVLPPVISILSPYSGGVISALL